MHVFSWPRVLLLPMSASADITLTYLGAFKAFSASNGVYDGGLTFYPSGNGGAGSLFISRGSTSGGGDEIWELTIPALVITTNVNSLNTATTLTLLRRRPRPPGPGLAEHR